jgi:hypothetical protein
MLAHDASLNEHPMLIVGSCHCGNITFTLDWAPDPQEIPARACTCTFCLKHGGVWTSHQSGVLQVKEKNPALVSRYAFGTQTADFHVCTRCGAVPLVTSAIDGRTYAVVNVNTFENVDASLLRKDSSNVDGESTDDRLSRRKRNWIADVRFP